MSNSRLLLFVFVVSSLAGCGGRYSEPTIDDFNGKLTHKGQPIRFSPNEKVVLRLVLHKNGERFGIPISSDGTFDIGWMPIGEYSAVLERTATSSEAGTRSAGKQTFNVPQNMTITEGQTQYALELGEEFKP
jgi:hypothetical protein